LQLLIFLLGEWVLPPLNWKVEQFGVVEVLFLILSLVLASSFGVE
jgi:hypothetical protein